MAQIIPHSDFSVPEMMAAVTRLAEKGTMKIQEAHARATNEILNETFIAGYEQAMRDFNITPKETKGE
jgi:hypothetical protein